MIRIQNNLFSVGIRPEGAELCSLKVRTDDRELIWQADPAIWGGSAPILFPIIGKLKNGATQINGASYQIPKHGLLRTRTASVEKQTDDAVTLRFESDPESLALFPFPFVFRVTFRLNESGLSVSYGILNNGAAPMLFSVGSHPAFALDLENHALSDYSIEFSEAESLELYGLQDGLLVRRGSRFLEDEQSIPLSASLFLDDALIFKEIKSRSIRLRCRGESTGIEVDVRDNPHLGLWAKPGSAYVCIEPWHSFDDAADSDGVFEHKPGILSLAANDIFETGYTIRPVTE